MGRKVANPEEGKTYWVLVGHPSKIVCLPMAVTVVPTSHGHSVSYVGRDPWSGKKFTDKYCPVQALYRTERAALRVAMKETTQVLSQVSRAIADGQKMECFYREQHQAQKERWNQIVPEKFQVE